MIVRRGTLIHTEKPFVWVISSNLRNSRCDNCFSDGELLKCSGCKYVWYCNRNCQKRSWPDHKAECKNLAKLPTGRELPQAARILAKVIIKLNKEGKNEKGYFDNNKFRMFKDLMSHYSDIKDDPKRAEHAMCLYHVLIDFMGEENLPNYTEFIGIYGRLVVNGFNILDGEMSTLGTGIYLGASTIDHSCEPNAVATFDGLTLTIRTVSDIRDYSWSKVRIAYVDLLKLREDRLTDLKTQYFFDCGCPKCNANADKQYTESCMLCRSCFNAVDTEKDEVMCTKCNWVPDSLENYFEVAKFVRLQHQVMTNIANFDICKLCLEKMDGIFHADNILYVKTLDLAFDSAIKLEMWEDCLKLAPKLIEGYKKYCGAISPILGITYMLYGKILLLQNQNDKALTMLEEADVILQMTHGKEHPLHRNELKKLMTEAKLSWYCS